MSSSLRVRLAWAVLVATLLLLFASPAAAQRGAEVTVVLSAEVVEVGEPFVVKLRALVESGPLPGDPQLGVPSAISVVGPQTATQSAIRMGGGSFLAQQGISATWQAVAKRTGTFDLGPATVRIGNKQVRASGHLRVEVVEPGSRPRPRRPSGSLLPGGLGLPFPILPDPFADFEPEEPEVPESGKKLAMRSAPDPHVFIRAIPDKTRAVVGEQVTVSYYVYYTVSFSMTERNEPALADFLRVSMLEDRLDQRSTWTTVGNRPFNVKLIDRMAIFPLRAGKLSTGVFSGTFRGQSVRGEQRSSEDVVIDVREPPLDERPVGYRLGDVGKYRLTANVTPREIEQGGTVAVQVRLTGVGRLPAKILLPERQGLEWLEPVTQEETKITGGRIGGWRSFGYVVRVDEAGDVALGRVRLPYYDADEGKYDVAFVDLGSVKVRPGAAPEPDAGAPAAAGGDTSPLDQDPFAAIARPRSALRPFSPPATEGFEPRLLWALVLGPPLSVLLFAGVRLLVVGLLRRRRELKEHAGSRAERALDEMKKQRDPKDVAAAAERAIHLAVEAASGLRSRGVLLDELPAALRSRDMDGALAAEVHEALRVASAIRFDPDPEAGQADALSRRTRALVKQLARLRPPSAPGPSGVAARESA